MQRKNTMTILKYAAVAAFSSFITHNCSNTISYYANTIKFCNLSSENGFVSKDQAFLTKMVHEKNSKGNIESYLQLDDIKYEICARENGLILGDAKHNWNNFNDEEKKDLITLELYNADQEKLEKFLGADAYISIFKKVSGKKRAEIINEIAKTMEKDELESVLSKMDGQMLWDSIPNEAKREILLKNLNISTKKTLDEIKGMMKGFWVEHYGY